MHNVFGQFPQVRLRRLRLNQQVRKMLSLHAVSPADLIMPIFVRADINEAQEIVSMPRQKQYPLKDIPDLAYSISKLGIPGILLFGVPSYKDDTGSSSWQDDGIVQQAIRAIKRTVPELLVIADACFCEYTSHGHCGIIKPKLDNNITNILSDVDTLDVFKDNEYELDNDATLEVLALQALSLAKAGADIIAPSGMIDGMIKVIRNRLDQEGFINLPIISYAVKYNSSFYAPFREAACGSPRFGDRATYQMEISQSDQSLYEAALDLQEGADMLIVKPAHSYLDIIAKLKNNYPYVPLVAYHVSGEYAMLKSAVASGYLDEFNVVSEVLLAMKRAGAKIIITYYAYEYAQWYNQNS